MITGCRPDPFAFRPLSNNLNLLAVLMKGANPIPAWEQLKEH